MSDFAPAPPEAPPEPMPPEGMAPEQPEMGPPPPQMAPPPGPPPLSEAAQDAQEEELEIELRDHLGAALAKTALSMTQQVAFLSASAPDAGQCKDMAQAVLYMTEALVLVAPLEESGATAGPGGGPVPLAPKHMPPQTSLNRAQQEATGRLA